MLSDPPTPQPLIARAPTVPNSNLSMDVPQK